ncbi:hypothetical protein LY76DRAFT_671382, partial [Colletotrichum caudatum]
LSRRITLGGLPEPCEAKSLARSFGHLFLGSFLLGAEMTRSADDSEQFSSTRDHCTDDRYTRLTKPCDGDMSGDFPNIATPGLKSGHSLGSEDSPRPDFAKQAKTLLDWDGDDRERRHVDYTVGWICALHIELAASRAMLDC